ncbi:hypothetical protein PO909_012885 [Leuciscus waleckii]
MGQSQICPPPWSSAWSEDGPKTDLLACMEEGGAAFLGTNKARKPMEKGTLVPSSQKNDKVPKNLQWVQSSMLSDLPGRPREGGPSWVRVRFARHPWCSAWCEDGPKTDLRACMEEGSAVEAHTRSPPLQTVVSPTQSCPGRV